MFLGAISIYSAGVFFVPMEQAYGWSRSETSLGLTIFLIGAVLGTPLVGALVDRFGPRRVGLPGAALYLASVGLLGFAGPNIASWYMLWTLVAILALGSKPNIYAAAVASRFSRNRGIALGVTLIGASVAHGVTPTLAEFCIDRFGLRFAFLGIAGITALVTLPLLWLFFFGSSDLERLESEALLPRPRMWSKLGTLPRNAFSLTFFKLILAALAGSIILSGFGAHLVPLLISKGIDAKIAASIMIVAGIGSISGRLVCGWLMDNFNPVVVGASIFALPIFGLMLCMQLDGSIGMAVVAIAFLGFSLGGEVDILAYLTSNLFEPQEFGRLFGIIISTLALGAASGSQLASGIFDMTKSYDLMLQIGMPLMALGAGALAILPRAKGRLVPA